MAYPISQRSPTTQHRVSAPLSARGCSVKFSTQPSTAAQHPGATKPFTRGSLHLTCPLSPTVQHREAAQLPVSSRASVPQVSPPSRSREIASSNSFRPTPKQLPLKQNRSVAAASPRAPMYVTCMVSPRTRDGDMPPTSALGPMQPTSQISPNHQYRELSPVPSQRGLHPNTLVSPAIKYRESGAASPHGSFCPQGKLSPTTQYRRTSPVPSLGPLPKPSIRSQEPLRSPVISTRSPVMTARTSVMSPRSPAMSPRSPSPVRSVSPIKRSELSPGSPIRATHIWQPSSVTAVIGESRPELPPLPRLCGFVSGSPVFSPRSVIPTTYIPKNPDAYAPKKCPPTEALMQSAEQVMRESSSVTTLGFFNSDDPLTRSGRTSVTEAVVLGDDELSTTNPNVQSFASTEPTTQLSQMTGMDTATCLTSAALLLDDMHRMSMRDPYATPPPNGISNMQLPQEPHLSSIARTSCPGGMDTEFAVPVAMNLSNGK